jgi:small subunit ribosomal protein S17e
MGRIKTMLIKRTTNNLVKQYAGECKKSFNENKEVASRYVSTKSKKMRNVIAGYVTRLMKKQTE